jgi:hypothetical protein
MENKKDDNRGIVNNNAAMPETIEENSIKPV